MPRSNRRSPPPPSDRYSVRGVVRSEDKRNWRKITRSAWRYWPRSDRKRPWPRAWPAERKGRVEATGENEKHWWELRSESLWLDGPARARVCEQTEHEDHRGKVGRIYRRLSSRNREGTRGKGRAWSIRDADHRREFERVWLARVRESAPFVCVRVQWSLSGRGDAEPAETAKPT